MNDIVITTHVTNNYYDKVYYVHVEHSLPWIFVTYQRDVHTTLWIMITIKIWTSCQTLDTLYSAMLVFILALSWLNRINILLISNLYSSTTLRFVWGGRPKLDYIVFDIIVYINNYFLYKIFCFYHCFILFVNN